MMAKIVHYAAMLSLALGGLAQYMPTQDCPILGPSFLADFDMTQTTAIQELQSSFEKTIESAFADGIVNRTHTSFTIDVFSTYTNDSIYSYHHEAPALNGSLTAGVLNDETMYRIGSVSKLFTVYAILAHAGGLQVFDCPVTDYVPELAGNAVVGADPIEKIVWENVTVGALASQMGGSGAFPLESVICFNGSQSDCSIPDFVKTMKESKRPVTPPFQTALYSDAGFGILGRVLEGMAGLAYQDALLKWIAEPLGLNSTMTMAPTGKDVNGLIVPGALGVSSWGFDNQISAPSGGVYSNAHDLRKLGLAILHSELLSPDSTREWMKPRSGTGSLTNSVGAPWEINRLPIPVSPNSNRTRISDLYTKSGGQAGYGTVYALSPDHGLGFSVLLAGETSLVDRFPLRALVGEAWLTAAEHAAAEIATKNFAGTFVDEAQPDNNLTLTVDAGRPGLGLESFYYQGLDGLPFLISPGGNVGGLNLSARLYPTGLESPATVPASNTTSWTKHYAYRGVADVVPPAPRGVVQGGKGMFDDGCEGWFSVDFSIIYNNGLDAFVFETVDGRLAAVKHVETNSTMKRVGG